MANDFLEGSLDARPAAAAAAASVFLATDTSQEFFSTGAAWLDVERGSDEAVPGGPAVLTSVGSTAVISYVDAHNAPHNVQYHG
jgi:hypothetical protein